MLTRRHIRIKVMQSVYSFKVGEGKMLDDEIIFFKDSIAKSYDLYFLMFSLLKSIKQYVDDQLVTYNTHKILKDQKLDEFTVSMVKKLISKVNEKVEDNVDSELVEFVDFTEKLDKIC